MTTSKSEVRRAYQANQVTLAWAIKYLVIVFNMNKDEAEGFLRNLS